MKGIRKKRVFVTGATQGIGRVVAERFFEGGASVLLTDVVSGTVSRAVLAISPAPSRSNIRTAAFV